MSKASPASVTHINAQTLTQPVYVAGEKVYYTWNGRQLPCIVVGTLQSKGASDNSGAVYTVQGDIHGVSYPAGAPIGPFKNVVVAQLSDRN